MVNHEPLNRTSLAASATKHLAGKRANHANSKTNTREQDAPKDATRDDVARQVAFGVARIIPVLLAGILSQLLVDEVADGRPHSHTDRGQLD